MWALLFVIARLLTLTLSVLTFSFGLPRTENQGFSLAQGNFNVLTIRQVRMVINRKSPECLLASSFTLRTSHGIIVLLLKRVLPTSQDDLPGGDLSDASLDDVEIH